MVLSKRIEEPHINIEYIYSKISQYDIYNYYLSGQVKIGEVICSPFRRERNPSFSLYITGSGTIHHRDHADDRWRGGPIDLVEQLYNLDLKGALQKIAKDFRLTEGNDEHKRITSQYVQPIIDVKRTTLIQVTTKKLTSADKEYWGQYLITPDDLRANNVYSVKDWFCNRKKQDMGKTELCYAYHYPGKGFKIYMPQRSKDKGKWKSSIPCSLVEGLEKLNGDPRVLITKSLKDRVTLQKIVPYPVINVQNEGISAYTEEFRKLLEGRQVVINYDADEAGVKNCKRICDMWKYNYVNTPIELLKVGVKDISDWVKYAKGYKEVEEFMRQKLVIP